MAYVEVDGVPVHYVEHGPAGPGVGTVVLVHGFPVDHRIMTGAFEPVFTGRPGWRRLYVDLPGMGRTVAPDVASTDDVFRILRGTVEAWDLVERYPRATFAVLDRAGHGLDVEQRGLFEALVGEWLDRVEEAGPA